MLFSEAPESEACSGAVWVIQSSHYQAECGMTKAWTQDRPILSQALSLLGYPTISSFATVIFSLFFFGVRMRFIVFCYL